MTTVLFAALALAIAAPGVALAQQSLPHRVVGTASIGGSLAPNGAIVKALVDGNEVGSATVTNDAYKLDILGNFPGKTVDFTVNGLAATQTLLWEYGGLTRLDLTALAQQSLASIGGSLAPNGAIVKALVDGNEVGSATVTNDAYKLDILGNFPGKTVDFTVNGLAATQTLLWEYGGLTRLDLTALAQQSLPHRVVGTASIGGSLAPNGAIVKALVDGNEVGSATVTNDAYKLDILGNFPGKTVDFTVNGLAATQTLLWEYGGLTRLDLTATASIEKYDADGDGFIEVSNLEQLNAIRHDLDGNGRPDSNSGGEAYADAFPVAATEVVCNNCNGYELTRSLDFRDSGSYASGAVDAAWISGIGWLPIGLSHNQFDTTFDGNGHTISNLYINRTTILENPGAVGLFGFTGSSSVIREVGLVDVDVTGDDRAGGLAGYSRGTVSASYATGSVSGDWYVGGLAGRNSGTVSASYATGSVSGDWYVGGLAGGNSGTVSASYATGSVSGDWYVGGLAGGNSGTVIASYATGKVSGERNVGGLIGNNSGEVIGGLWDTRTSGLGTGVGSGGSAGVRGAVTAELQSPTGYTGIYGAWDIDLDNADQDFDPTTGAEDFWDFGTSSQYPALKVDFDGDGSATWQEFGNQRGQPMTIAPSFSDGEGNAITETGRSVAENTAAGENIGDPVAATDADSDTLTYTLGGADAESFDIEESSGQLKTKAALDFETRATYTVNVTATDPSSHHTTITVTISVTNVGLSNPYDADDNGKIEKNEAIAAVRDYFNGKINKEEAIAIIRLYFSS